VTAPQLLATLSIDIPETDNAMPSYFHQLAEDLQFWSAVDEIDNDTANCSSFGSSITTTLAELFEGGNINWVEGLQREALGSLNDEVDIKKLLDFDAPGASSDAFYACTGIESIIST
jgi:hypothetical protein